MYDGSGPVLSLNDPQHLSPLEGCFGAPQTGSGSSWVVDLDSETTEALSPPRPYTESPHSTTEWVLVWTKKGRPPGVESRPDLISPNLLPFKGW